MGDDMACADGLIAPCTAVVSEASVESADDSSAGSVRPRFSARRRMPLAERADSEYLCGALGCKTSVRVVRMASQAEDEDPSAALGHSEVASVENPKRPPIPEFPQATDERCHVSPAMTGEEARYVLEEDGGRSVSLHKGEEAECEDAALAGEPSAFAGDAEVLAGETSGPEDSCPPISTFVGIPVPWLPAVALVFA